MNRLLLLTIFGLILGVGSSFAEPFDLIVPAEVVVRTEPGIGAVGTPWGWVVATDAPLTHDQFQNAIITLSTDDPAVTVTTTFNPPFFDELLLPGEVSGLDVSPFTDPLHALLRPGEMVNPATANNWRWLISFSPQFIGEVNLHTVLEMDGMAATFDTLLRLNPSYGTEMDPLAIVSAQRLSAIPEPSTGVLLVVGCCALLTPRRRKAAAQSHA